MSEQPAGNVAMGRYWNEVAGPRWVGRRAAPIPQRHTP